MQYRVKNIPSTDRLRNETGSRISKDRIV